MEKLSTIILLTDCFNDTAAGAEKQIFELAKGLARDNYNVIIVSLDACSPAVFPLVKFIGARLEVFRVKRIYGISGLIQGFRFYKFLRSEKADVVQTYHFGSDIWGTVIARLAGIKAIISNRRDMGFWRSGHHVKAYRWVNRWVSKIVVNARSIKDMVIKTEDVTPAKIEVIYNGVEFELAGSHVETSRPVFKIEPHDVALVHVANLKEVKGHIYLFEAIHEIVKVRPNVKLLLVGEDMYHGLLQKKAEELNIKEHVQFLGKRQDVGAILAISDIAVLPSLSEGLSNAILEYMVAGKPVVATDVGGNPELVENGISGFLVPKMDSRRLAEALLKLIESKELRESMGHKGRQKVIANFSMPAMTKRYEDLFDSLLPRKIRVLHFISSGGLFGAENVLLSVAQGFNNDRFISIVSAIRDGRNPNLDVIERARSLDLPTHIFESKGRLDLQTIKDLKAFIMDKKIDVLHTHNYKSDIIGALAAEGTKAALVSTAHGFTGMNSKVSWYEHLDRWFLKNKFRTTVVVTDQMLPDFPSDKRRIIGNGIDFRKFTANPSARKDIRQRYQINDNDFVIGTVGRLSAEKNQAMLLAAMAEICRKRQDVKIMLIGEGPEGDALHGFVRATGFEDKVIFTGLISDPAPFYQAFDLFVLSSRTEGVPLTLLEAMASHIPVVATRVGGIPQIVTHDQTGLLVDSLDVKELQNTIEALINDKPKRELFKDAAFHFAKENYSIDRMNRLYQDVYEELATK